MIGIWPLGSQFRSLDAYVSGLLDTAQTVGPAHVGIGTDLFGLGGSTVIPGYEQFAQLEALMTKRGFNAEDVKNILGANYLRALGAAQAV